MKYGLKKKITKCIVIPDIHAPEQDSAAYKCMLDFLEQYDPGLVVVLGDVGEFGSVSAWDRKKNLVVEGKRVKSDMAAAVGALRDIAVRSPRADRFVTLGNHEERMKWYIDENALLQGLEEMDVKSNYEDAGYRVADYGEFLQIGKLLFTHGLYTNMYHTKKTLVEVGHPVVYGHTHDHQEHSVAQYDLNSNFPQEKEASSSGCLCNMNPAFMKNRQKRWTHGFQTVEFLQNGLFFRSFHKIIAGMTVINGKVYGG